MSGFTLLELMVVVVIAAILMGVAVPALGDWIRNARLTSTANDLVASLHHARSESIKRRLPVVLCASANPLSEGVTLTCNGSATLTGAGWIVFVDGNRNGQADASSFDDLNGNGVRDMVEDTNGNGVLEPGEDIGGDGVSDLEPILPAEEVIQRHDLLHPKLKAKDASGTIMQVTYLDTGFPDAGTSLAIVVCDARGNVDAGGNLSAARAITMSPTGRPGVTRDKAAITALGGCP